MIRLYNTLTKQKEEFSPLEDNEVRMYHCGPTVYGVQHLGNMRAFVLWDLLTRILHYNGYSTKRVINITDFGHLTSDADVGEDKMMKGLKREGMEITLENMLALGKRYEEVFKNDLKALHVLMPDVFPRASEHIKENIALIQILEEKGYTYTTKDGVYFDTQKDEDYGKLRNSAPDAGESRIEVNTEKRSPADFALWKFNKELGWESPWGKGFPGWHIECSAMSEKYLSLPFDIHTGGIEHIPIHHTNEIAQTESAYNTQMARFWLHNNHLLMDSEKIAKSVGNVVYLQDVIDKGYNPLAVRYLFLGTHYKKEQDFSWEALEAAANTLSRLNEVVCEFPHATTPDPVYKEKFNEVINDDLNIPQAIAVMWDLVRDDSIEPGVKKATLLDFDTVLGLSLDTQTKKNVSVPEEVRNLAQTREEARKNKDFDKADELRNSIEEYGFTVIDTDEGPEIKQIKDN